MSAEMLQIRKWPVALTQDVQEVGNGKVLMVSTDPIDPGKLRVWTADHVVEGDNGMWADGDIRKRRVIVAATGDIIEPQTTVHLGSVVIPPYVWHVFEVTS